MTKPVYLYHGSQALLERLEPRSARAGRGSGEPLHAVYASPERAYATAFGLPIVGDDRGKVSWSLEYRTRIPRITIHKGSLDLSRHGYLYRVPSKDFLRLDEFQWVAYMPVVPHDYELVDPSRYAHWIVGTPGACTQDGCPGKTRLARGGSRRAALPVFPSRLAVSRIDFIEIQTRVIGQFPLAPDSIHGPAHWRRVERNGLKLAAHTGADVSVIRLFAIFHDCRRENDLTDIGHGARGAEFATTFRHMLHTLTDESFERLHVACALHTDDLRHSDPTIGTCWDADRLDLTRVGVLPDPRFMSTDFGRKEAKRLSMLASTKPLARRGAKLVSAYGGL
jgi:uncharacterized protein